jgi:hypothetical protein
MDLDRAEKLLSLATDESTTEEERRTAAVKLASLMKEADFLPAVRKLVTYMDGVEVMLKRRGSR